MDAMDGMDWMDGMETMWKPHENHVGPLLVPVWWGKCCQFGGRSAQIVFLLVQVWWGKCPD